MSKEATIGSAWFKGFGIAIGGAIVFFANCTLAQITPDTTLPNNSRVNTSGNTINIEGGTQAGSNLFHSFQQFSVLKDMTAYFRNAADVQNIISRVTGNSISNIDGLIRANGTANLFLINPNGIIFGQNARLNIGGSFFATSANSMKFADGLEFSATNPKSTPLLTINVPIGLQFGSNAGSVSIRESSLQVNPGKSLAFIGGNVSMDGGKLVAPSGRVELGGVAGENTVGLFPIGDSFGLNFPQGVPQADVSLTNQAEVNVLSSSGGSIAVNAANLNISGGSQLLTGISGVGLPNTQAGDIKINATGIVAIADGSKLSNEVAQNAVGNSGNISVNADSLSLSNNSFLAASTKNQGNAGNVTINTRSLSVFKGSFLAASANGQGDAGNITINAHDTVSFDQGSRAYTNVTLKGDGGDINITTGSLFVTDNSFLASSTNGEGNSGNITVNARDTISFDRGSANTGIEENGKGQGGNFNITTESLSLTNGAQLVASTKNQGNAGNIIINTGLLSVSDNSFLAASANGKQGNAGNIDINARKTATFDAGSAYTDVTVTGNGGDININTQALDVKNRAYLFSKTSGNGDAGNINITTNSLSVTNESILAASGNGQGNARNITIKASERVLFDRAGQLYTDVTGTGNGGEISITTGLLTVTNASKLSASTSGVGNAGNLTFNTGSFFVTNNSQLSASSSGVGNAGNLTFNTGSLSVTNESFLASSANGQGNAGSITINARDTVSFENGAKVYTDVNLLPFNSTTEVKGNGGDIKISSGSLFVTNGAQLISNTQGEGDAGNITINTGSLSVTNEAFLASSANGQQGNAGNITVDARDRVLFDKGSAFSNVGVCSLIAVGCSSSNNTIKGNGGDITIAAPSLQLMNGSFLVTGVGDDIPKNNVAGNAGNISIHLRDDLSLGQSFITTRLFTDGKGKAGDIDIRAGFVSSYQSLISASTQGQGNAGGVSVQTTGAISLADSDISTAVQKGATGDAQGINITARSLFLTDGAQLNAVTSGEGKAGNILINTTDKVSVSGTNTTVAPTNLFQNNIPPRFNSPPKFVDGVESGIFTSTNSSGDGGNITVNTNTFSISNGSVVDARTTASGRGGAIKVYTNTFEAMSGGQLNGITSGSGPAGSITLNATGTVTIRDSDPTYMTRLAQFVSDKIDIYGKPKVGNQGAASGLFVSTAGAGLAGDITLKVSNDITLAGQGSGLFASTTVGSTGNGGNIDIDPATVIVKNGAGIAVNSAGAGNAGNIRLRANALSLDSGAFISAKTASGEGGNITLDAPSLLLLRRQSLISATAGNNQNGGNGGNITINTPSLVAVPAENSDISADAFTGNGGQVTIDARGIFGTQFREQLTPESDITASSIGGGINGLVTINTPDVNPSLGLLSLPAQVVERSGLIAQGCAVGDGTTGSQFTVTGRGGLPPSPYDPLTSASVWEDARLATTTVNEQRSHPHPATPPSGTVAVPIVPASGWVFNNNGQVTLTAFAPNVPASIGSNRVPCHGFQK